MLKHPKGVDKGSFHSGEQEWMNTGTFVSGYPIIRQWNVRSGECYEHVTSHRWYERCSFVDSNPLFKPEMVKPERPQGPMTLVQHQEFNILDNEYALSRKHAIGMAWTMRELVPETFMFRFAACPNVGVIPEENWSSSYAKTLLGSKAQDLKIETFSAPTVTLNDSEHDLVSANGYVVVPSDDGGTRKIVIRNVALYNMCKIFIGGKPRTPATMADLNRYAKRMAQPGQLYAGAPVVEIESRHLQDIIHAAFYSDVSHENSLLVNLGRQKDSLLVHNRMMQGKGMVNTSKIADVIDGVLQTALVCEDIRNAKLPAKAAMSHFVSSRTF